MIIHDPAIKGQTTLCLLKIGLLVAYGALVDQFIGVE